MSLVAIVGPTAVGKSAVAMHLAGAFSGEIINADSRQVYRYLDIGTAKPSVTDRKRIPHHLLDIVEPDQDFSLALYQTLAFRALDKVRATGKMAILVGGSGLYVWSVLERRQLPDVPPHPALRAELAARAVREGPRAIYDTLVKADPEAARRIDPRNLRRVIRAIEVCQSGTPFSQMAARGMHRDSPPLVIGLTAKRDELYRAIDQRVDLMMQQGLVEEVRGLRHRGYGPELPSLSGIGYRQINLYLDGTLSLSEAVQRMKFDTHRFARHQYAWFRPGDRRIQWIEGPGFDKLAEELVSGETARKE